MSCEKVDAAAILEGVPSRLKVLHIQSQMKKVDHRFATRTLPWMPELVEFRTLPLELSSGLTTFNGIHHRITAQHLADHRWICAGLKTFRCQIVRLPTLTKSDRALLDSISAGSVSTEDPHHIWALEKQQWWLDIHWIVYDQLASLTQLTVLDLGWEGRDVWRWEESIVRPSDVWSEEPIYETLELSLASGLDLLAPLTKLEVFGFDGVNHKIGKQELEWMARTWIRLKIMRGLHASTDPRITRLASGRTELQEYMQTLQPDVVHQAALPLSPSESTMASLY
ncbi:hypothetical protein BGX29_006362 [Mortierella sp. GBA35]|nr:hypothetical protein BGX29_006362 [Mortierella sp. GBA35]